MFPIADWFRRNLSDPQVVLLTVLIGIGLLVIVYLGDMLAPVLASVVTKCLPVLRCIIPSSFSHRSAAPPLQLAWASTIHKAQGSEYPAVVVPISTQHYPMLQRNLVYTGITRGRKLVVLVAQTKALAIAVQRGLDVPNIDKLITRIDNEDEAAAAHALLAYASELLAKIEEISKIFWETKQA